jgi:hypothetical protein
MAPAEHIERQPLKGMTRTNDLYLVRIAIEMIVAVVGSLSSGLLGPFRTPTCSSRWRAVWLIGACCI